MPQHRHHSQLPSTAASEPSVHGVGEPVLTVRHRKSKLAKTRRGLTHLVWVALCFVLTTAVFGFGLLHWGWEGHTLEFAFIATGFLGCALVAWGLILSQHWHGHLSMDHDLSGIQKSHTQPVPRVGGVAIFMGFSLSACLLMYFGSVNIRPLWVEFGLSLMLLLFCSLPAFVIGLVEDLTKKVSVFVRLLATFSSAGLAAYFLDAVLPRLDFSGIDTLMAYTPVAAVVTIFAVGGVANAVNIIDGFNGLASGVMVMLGLGFAGFAAVQGDPLLLVLSLSLSASAAGFMVFNFPYGRIFLGDGGAYFLGFYLAELAVLTCVRHPNISSWTILTILAYPVVEVVVSIARRRWNKMSPSQPDRGHLHQQMQSFLQRYYGVVNGRAVYIVNPQVSPFLWGLVLLNLALAFACRGSIFQSVLGFVLACGIYLGLYVFLVLANHRTVMKTAIAAERQIKPVKS